MTDALASDPRGNALIDLSIATVAQLASAAERTPCPLALVVLVDKSTRQVLYGRNRWRGEYELPGGLIDEGESYHDAARRELQEESGIQVDDLDLIGFARFSLANPSREELAAVYFARVADPSPRDSDELDTFVCRAPLSPSTLTISPLDDAIAHWAVGLR